MCRVHMNHNHRMRDLMMEKPPRTCERDNIIDNLFFWYKMLLRALYDKIAYITMNEHCIMGAFVSTLKKFDFVSKEYRDFLFRDLKKI